VALADTASAMAAATRILEVVNVVMVGSIVFELQTQTAPAAASLAHDRSQLLARRYLSD
jgi:hypothetical protein